MVVSASPVLKGAPKWELHALGGQEVQPSVRPSCHAQLAWEGSHRSGSPLGFLSAADSKEAHEYPMLKPGAVQVSAQSSGGDPRKTVHTSQRGQCLTSDMGCANTEGAIFRRRRGDPLLCHAILPRLAAGEGSLERVHVYLLSAADSVEACSNPKLTTVSPCQRFLPRVWATVLNQVYCSRRRSKHRNN